MNKKIRVMIILIILFGIFDITDFKELMAQLNKQTDISKSIYYSPADSGNIVERFGQLQIDGNKIVDKNGNPIALRGMSLFWSQWMGKYYNYDCIEWLRDDWKCMVVRAAMGIESGGYLTNPVLEKAKIKTVIDACIDLGIYVIVDWHDHNAHNHRDEAISFFKEIANEYGNTPNLIYEIYNEPQQVSWLNVVKPYADSVVKHIREIDPDNLIIVGTPTWSQDVDIAANNPLTYENIAYALHFYAATHKQQLRNKATNALNKGVALFVSEWGTCESSGTGFLDSLEVENWSKFMDANKLSWCNWSIADKEETSAALKPGANAYGGWIELDLTQSGSIIKSKTVAWSDSILNRVENDKSELPLDFELYQNYPNPFNPSTNFGFRILDFPANLPTGQAGGADVFVSLKIYDVIGNELATVVNEELAPGEYNFPFSISHSSLSSGIYFYKLSASSRAATFTDTKKLVLLK